MLCSIIIRTYNEERYLRALLEAIHSQEPGEFSYEVIIVDSGSTDATREIARGFGCQIVHIAKEDFTFGRSLNVGCEAAQGDYFVLISGHCIPTDASWLKELCTPLASGAVSYCYGRQLGRDTTKFSEGQHFEKWFPAYPKIPQEGYFCNNANAAVSRESWEQYKFDEDLTGLEDMHLAKRLCSDGHKVGYASAAAVFHIHDETWQQTSIRYEREAIALYAIMPEVAFTAFDFCRFFLTGVSLDILAAVRARALRKHLLEIILFRFHQYRGSYLGNRLARVLSSYKKRQYFYPRDLDRNKHGDGGTPAHEGEQ